ncbi:hypothetical protein LTR74_009651 [Friedmanniomyces endolithicus]|nr:hypothetical protein LTR74_009651 [Friedmanniomyces endolithicus]
MEMESDGSRQVSQHDQKVRMAGKRKPTANAFCTTTKPITVVVGPDDKNETFYLHEELVTTHSDFFAAAMHKDWKEGQDRVIQLPEDDPNYFKMFASFIYTGSAHSLEDGDHDRENLRDWEYQCLALAWGLGNKLICIAFQDAIVDALINELMTEGPHYPLGLYRGVYTTTAGNCGLRRLVVDITVFIWPLGQLAKATAYSDCAEFYRDVAARLEGLNDEQRKRNPFLLQ